MVHTKKKTNLIKLVWVLAKAFEYQQNYEYKVDKATAYIKNIIGDQTPNFGVVLGSGLGDLANDIKNPIEIPYKKIPFFPIPTVANHDGIMLVGELEGVKVIGLKGRKHYYEVADQPFNTGMLQVIMPVHVLANLGVKNYFVTNAAGGINLDYNVGDVMIINSHINQMDNSLLGRQHDFLRVDNNNKLERFEPMNGSYDSKLIQILNDVASFDRSHIHNGIYQAVTGPTYETEGESLSIRHGFRADAVGMSTAPEVIVARNRGMNVVGISCITNNIDENGVNATKHEDVTRILESREVRDRLSTLVVEFFKEYKNSDLTSKYK